MCASHKNEPFFVKTIFERLRTHYGAQHWWPAEDPFEVILGAILTQATTWSNASSAISNLKQAHVVTIEAINNHTETTLATLIRPAGFQHAKARTIKTFAAHVVDRYGGNLTRFLAVDPATLRELLLSITGIGEETADDILLYSAYYPVFIIDNYTRRLFFRMGIISGQVSYRKLQFLMHGILDPDTSLYQEYHALIVEHGKRVCRKTPRCSNCCVVDLCDQAGVSFN